MTHSTRSIRNAAVLAVLAFLFVTGSTRAQVPWACAATTICNNSGCFVILTLNTTPAGAIGPITLLAGQCVNVNTAGVASIDAVVSNAGIAYPVLPPPPVAPCNCPAGTWSTCCVMLPPVPCCTDICFDPAACRIVIRPSKCGVAVCQP